MGIHSNNQDSLLSLSPREFEDTIAAMFQRLGYSVQQTPYSRDMGIDVIANKDGHKYIIQCKRYGKNNSVGLSQLKEFFATTIDSKAKGYFITTGRFTKPAKQYAREHEIEFIDLGQLIPLMRQAFPKSDDENIARVMCLECGDVVVFSLEKQKTEKVCKNGHFVKNDLKVGPLYRQIPGD